MIMLLLFLKLQLSCFQIQYLFINQHKQKSNTLKEELRYGSKPANTGKPQCGGFVKKSSDDQKVSCHFLSSYFHYDYWLVCSTQVRSALTCSLGGD